MTGVQTCALPISTNSLVGFNSDFDQYEGGPTLDAMRSLEGELAIGLGDAPRIYHAYDTGFNPLGSWEMWDDRGWRVMEGFCQTFNDQIPTPEQVKRHLIPTIGPLEKSCFLEETKKEITTLSFKQLHAATDKDWVACLTGILRGNQGNNSSYIRLDPELDSVVPEHLHHVCDIDSFILIHQNPPFVGSIGLHSIPLHRDRAPLTKHNHVFVEILVPRMDQIPPRQDYFEKRFKLFQIPHLELASFPRGGQLIVHFPRMIHKAPYSRFWSTNIDYNIKRMFYKRVFLPALKSSKPDWDLQYSAQTLESWEHQQGKGRNPKAIEVSGEEFRAICDCMRQLVCVTISIL